MCPASNSASSSRWSPTPEQVMILEEMYKVGIRTPNASQIQQITAHLSLYGKIEGKNVFYWFQNHKARDRQKLRRKLICNQAVQQLLHGGSHYYHHHAGGCHHQILQPHIDDQQLNVQHHKNINTSYSLLHYLNQPLTIGSDQHLFCNPNGLHNNQGAGGEDASTVEMMKNMRPWKAEVRPADGQKTAEKDKYSTKRRSIVHGSDHDNNDHEHNNNWTRMMMMMMMDPVGTHHEYNFPSCPYNYSTRPLRTLQLFPITTTHNLKEECSMNLPNNVN